MKFALIGYPIGNSPSPVMHNAAFAERGIAATYVLRPTQLSEVTQIKQELLQLLWRGLNVTTPLKTAMAQEVRCVGAAERARAVNTIFRSDGQWQGELTDVYGVEKPLHDRGIHNARALVIGSGGAARAAALALDALQSEVHIIARNVKNAQQVLQELRLPVDQRVHFLGDESFSKLVFSFDVLIQATPLSKSADPWPYVWQLKADCLRFDMNYLPKRTPFLDYCEGPVIEGWEMLLWQGAKAWELWTQQQAPVDVMRRALLQTIATVPFV